MKKEKLTKALDNLKPFQCRTVKYAFKKMFVDNSPTDRFLVADEVGLGKTLVAKGLVAKTILHLIEKKRRTINIVYISSNSAIAAQNTKKLRVSEDIDLKLNRRATLLPVPARDDSKDTGKKRVSLMSLTPGTTFKIQNSIGVKEERAFLYHLVKGNMGPKYHKALCRLFQGNASETNWKYELNQFQFHKIDRRIKKEFKRLLMMNAQEMDIIAKLKELCKKYPTKRKKINPEDKKTRNSLVAGLRQNLADICMKELKPSLIILDEFHRFSDLLYDNSPGSKLMNKLLNCSNYRDPTTKVLLLSATPYKMLTLSEDQTESNEHFEEFKKVVMFLFGEKNGDKLANEIFNDFDLFRKKLRSLPNNESKSEAMKLKEKIQKKLRKVIARTERTSDVSSHESIKPIIPNNLFLEPYDLKELKPIMAIAENLKVPRIIEYWKSSPYLLNFMLDYDLKKKLRKVPNTQKNALLKAVEKPSPKSLQRGRLNDYGVLNIPNARMRQLVSDVFKNNFENFLWIPPSMPYYSTKKMGKEIRFTKSLVFSSWRFTPLAISALLSYEAERKVRSGTRMDKEYFAKDTTTPLSFQIKRSKSKDKNYAGLRAFLLFYPSPSLAKLADPLQIYAENSEVCTLPEMKRQVSSKLIPARDCLRNLLSKNESEVIPDWIMPALIDRSTEDCEIPKEIDDCWLTEWLKYGFTPVWNQVNRRKSSNPDVESSIGEKFINHVIKVMKKPRFNKLPQNYESILNRVSLGSPAVCALRALKRITRDSNWEDWELLSSAAKIALGFRVMFNQRETREIVNKQEKGTYVESVLNYCVNHNLQSVLDEYVHYLFDELSLEDKSDCFRIKEVSNAIATVLATSPSHIEIDSISENGGQFKFSKKKTNIRGRFAMRLSEKESTTKKSRIDNVRNAFNSPFKPFVLSTTSIGQEGLDFHPYCYRIYHWNLPKNPVELEQREGRIHRYKNHVVRLNLAEKYSQNIRGGKDDNDGREIKSVQSNPWDYMFERAQKEYSRDGNKSKLKPFWTLDGLTSVEQHILMLFLSNENQKFEQLKRSRQVYRLTFGHQNQNELLDYLSSLSEKELTEQDIADLQINLEPL